MSSTMKSINLLEPNVLKVEEIPVPECKDDEVLIKVDYCSICGSDAHIYKTGDYIALPQVLGHEFAGTVVAIGDKVKADNIAVGDRVTCNPTAACGRCPMCQEGKPNICCNALTATVGLGFSGANANYTVQKGNAFFYKLPDSVSTKAACLIEPLSVAVHAVQRRSKIRLDDIAVVFGAGVIGLLTAAVLKTVGCVKVIQVDMSAKRLETAKKLGVDYVIDASKTKDVVAAIAEITGPGYYGPDGAYADLVYECAGASITMEQAVKVVGHGGQLIAVAVSFGNVPLNLSAITQKEITLAGSYAYTNDFKTALGLLEAGKIDIENVISHTFTLDQAEEAYKMQLNAKECVKAVFDCR